jgi:hypothetical protein
MFSVVQRLTGLAHRNALWVPSSQGELLRKQRKEETAVRNKTETERELKKTEEETRKERKKYKK